MQFYRVMMREFTFAKLWLPPCAQTFKKLKRHLFDFFASLNKDDSRKWLSFDLLMVTLIPVIYHMLHSF